jgi:enoyl-CoA hydratase/carnithine racemase
MNADVVEYTVEGAVGTVRLNRPQRRNAVDEEVIKAWEAVLADLERPESPIRCVVLTSARCGVFCAGADLDYLASVIQAGAGDAWSRRVTTILDRLWLGPQVVIGAVHGLAVGGGCELVTACHLVVAEEDAAFQFVHAEKGLSTGWGGGLRLLRNLGRARALRLFLTADRIDAAEALRLGMASKLVPPGTVETEAAVLAERVAGLSPASVQAFLDLARSEATENFRAVREREIELFGLLSRPPSPSA